MADIRAQLTRVRDAANDVAISTTDRIKDGTEKARESASDLIQTSREKASDAYGDVRDRTQRAATRANEIVQEPSPQWRAPSRSGPLWRGCSPRAAAR